MSSRLASSSRDSLSSSFLPRGVLAVSPSCIWQPHVFTNTVVSYRSSCYEIVHQNNTTRSAEQYPHRRPQQAPVASRVA
ncbi:hypothetical protein MTP99_018103 [Tenebrio molitor]|nr:hypothetical protein MTP99_018103 [Tenebrio molitor]